MHGPMQSGERPAEACWGQRQHRALLKSCAGPWLYTGSNQPEGASKGAIGSSRTKLDGLGKALGGPAGMEQVCRPMACTPQVPKSQGSPTVPRELCLRFDQRQPRTELTKKSTAARHTCPPYLV